MILIMVALISSMLSGMVYNTVYAIDRSQSNLPLCPNTPIKIYGYKNHPAPKTWNNCFGRYTMRSGNQYTGEFKNGMMHGKGSFDFQVSDPKGEVYVGEWRNNNIYKIIAYENGVARKAYNKETNKWTKVTNTSNANISLMKSVFNNFSKNDRMTIQGVLKDLNYYTSKIDGLYGSNTKKAIEKYASSEQWSDIKSKNGIKNLLEIILNSKSKSNDMDDYIATLTDDALCTYATTKKHGKYIWTSIAYYREYVAEAKKKGLSCGVVNIINTCADDPSLCNDQELCKYATKIDSKGLSYILDTKHYREARSRDVKCVKECKLNSKYNISDPDFCSDIQICNFATNYDKNNNYALVWVNYSLEAQAKARGLTCGIQEIITAKKETCEDNYTLCSEFELCNKATIGNPKRWNSTFPNFVSFAKSKGYSCGVQINIATKQKTCKDDPSLCTVVQLCNKATITKDGKKSWSSYSADKSFVQEAKKNGVSCGVKVEVAKTEKKVELIPASSGSGFYVSEEGHIITNQHVIEGCSNVMVHKKGEVIKSKILATDFTNDLALIKVEKKPEVVFSLAKESPYLMQDITAAGYPLTNKLGLTLKVTKGIVSALSAPGNFSNIQIDAAIQPGNSGGPIFDEEGNVMGVVVAKLIDKDAQNVNFGIKASIVKNLLEANDVDILSPRTKKISKRSFSEEMTKGTVLLSCWMTMAQIKKLKTKKVFFKEYE